MAVVLKTLSLMVFITVCVEIVSGSINIAPNCQTCYQSAFEKLMKGTVFDDCCQIIKACKALEEGTDTGVFDLHGGCLRPKDNFQRNSPVIKARCDMETDNGGWTVILRRKKNSTPRINFRRPWEDYEEGFGNLSSEFWFGLSKIHCLTQRNEVDMRIELRNNDGTGKNLTYDRFEVAGPEDNYRLRVVPTSGPGFDPLDHSNGQPFSAYNKDNDGYYRINCALLAAQGNGGGWWYKVENDRCAHAYLTRPDTSTSDPCVFDGSDYQCYDNIEMKIRTKGCHVMPCASENEDNYN